MSQQFIGEIRMFAGPFAPQHWAFCNGQLMNISQNQALFSLLGTNFGGNGVSTFALPNLQGRIPVGQGQAAGFANYVLGQPGGTETVVLNSLNLPVHNHAMNVSTQDASVGTIGPTVLPGKIVTPPTGHFYTNVDGTSPAPVQGTLNAQSCSNSGSTTPHDNMMPSLAISYIIALVGIFPSRN